MIVLDTALQHRTNAQRAGGKQFGSRHSAPSLRGWWHIRRRPPTAHTKS